MLMQSKISVYQIAFMKKKEKLFVVFLTLHCFHAGSCKIHQHNQERHGRLSLPYLNFSLFGGNAFSVVLI